MPPPFPIPSGPVLAAIITEVVTSIGILIACLVIYFRTKEFYSLTKHEGIKYFRLAFLFFGLSFLPDVFKPLLRHAGRHIPPIPFAIFVFFGSLAAFALLWSVLWKRFGNSIKYPFTIGTFLALCVAAASMIRHYVFVALAVQGVVVLSALVVSYLDSRAAKKRTISLHILYVLFFCSWLATVIAGAARHDSAALSILFNGTAFLITVVIAVKVFRLTRRP